MPFELMMCFLATDMALFSFVAGGGGTRRHGQQVNPFLRLNTPSLTKKSADYGIAHMKQSEPLLV